MSPRLPVDFSEAKEFTPLPLEANPFLCSVTDIGEVQESDAGNLWFQAEFEVIEGEYAGRKLWRNYTITGEGAGFYLDFARKVMHNMDLERDEIAELETEDFLGQEIAVVIDHEDYQGETRNRVSRLIIPE